MNPFRFLLLVLTFGMFGRSSVPKGRKQGIIRTFQVYFVSPVWGRPSEKVMREFLNSWFSEEEVDNIMHSAFRPSVHLYVQSESDARLFAKQLLQLFPETPRDPLIDRVAFEIIWFNNQHHSVSGLYFCEGCKRITTDPYTDFVIDEDGDEHHQALCPNCDEELSNLSDMSTKEILKHVKKAA